MIKDYVAFTNKSLRSAVEEYFENKAAAERRHGKMGTWDVSRVTDMTGLFAGHHEFDEDISAWETSSVKAMLGMLCADDRTGMKMAFNQDISGWDVSSVEVMDEAFANCSRFCQDLSAWDTSSVRSMLYTFGGAENFPRAVIDSWDMSSLVTEKSKIFMAAELVYFALYDVDGNHGGVNYTMKTTQAIGVLFEGFATSKGLDIENTIRFRKRGDSHYVDFGDYYKTPYMLGYKPRVPGTDTENRTHCYEWFEVQDGDT